MPRTRSRFAIATWILGAAFGVSLLVWLLSRIPIAELIGVWRGVRWQILLVLPPLQVIGFVARAQRVRVLTDRNTPLLAYLSACSIGNLLNMLLPARVGDISRCLLLQRRTSTPLAGHLACLVLDRVYDLVAFCVLGAVSAAFLIPGHSSRVPQLSALGALVAGLALLLGILIAALRYPNRWMRRARIWFSRTGRLRTLRALDSFASREGQNHKRSLLEAGVLWTGAAISVDLIGTLLLVRAVLGDLPLLWVCLLASAFALGIAVPGAPGGLGIHQATSVLILGLAGVSAPRALGLSLLSDAMLIAIVAVMGILFLTWEGLSLGEATRLSRTEPDELKTGTT